MPKFAVCLISLYVVSILLVLCTHILIPPLQEASLSNRLGSASSYQHFITFCYRSQRWANLWKFSKRKWPRTEHRLCFRPQKRCGLEVALRASTKVLFHG